MVTAAGLVVFLLILMLLAQFLFIIGIFISLWLLNLQYGLYKRFVRRQVTHCVRGTSDEAWSRCLAALGSARMVTDPCMSGGDLGDELVSEMARRYPDPSPFVVEQLANPNPILAAHTALYIGLTGGAIDAGARERASRRSERIRVRIGLKFAETQTVGAFIVRALRYPRQATSIQDQAHEDSRPQAARLRESRP